jgi:hypothetical protein
MSDHRFEVEIVFRRTAHYVVEAADGETAERLALERWRDEDPGDVLEDQWGEVIGSTVTEAPDAAELRGDEERAMEMIRERELRLHEQLQLEGSESPMEHDAVSATEVALALGWVRRAPGGGWTPSILRAARALESLCGQGVLVCFSRDRVRSGERGQIRLYCTPQHLERLTAQVQDADELSETQSGV